MRSLKFSRPRSISCNIPAATNTFPAEAVANFVSGSFGTRLARSANPYAFSNIVSPCRTAWMQPLKSAFYECFYVHGRRFPFCKRIGSWCSVRKWALAPALVSCILSAFIVSLLGYAVYRIWPTIFKNCMNTLKNRVFSECIS